MAAEYSPPRTPTEEKMATYNKTSSLSLIRAAVVDERTQSVRYRQRQLLSLHTALRENYRALAEAISKDTNFTAAEADVEICLAMRCVKEAYTSLNFERSVELEYTVTKGKNFGDRRVGVGLVYLYPQSDNMIYSAVAPLSAAIAAGNCSIVQLENGYRASDILRRVIGQALDSDTFLLVDKTPSSEDLTEDFVQVLQDIEYEGIKSKTTIPALISPSKALAVAVVDRTADLEQAAKAIVTARFSFDGKSAYAPDYVLVNEYVKKKFTSAVLRCTTEYFSDRQGGDDVNRIGKKILDIAKEDQGTTSIVSSSRSTILSVENRSSPLLSHKVTGCILPIHAIRSLDDGIEVINDNESTHLATYFFADPAYAKYLSQFTKSHVSYINHIPAELLVGPAAPLNYPISSTSNRYVPSMFEKAAPQIIEQTTSSREIEAILLEESRTELTRFKQQENKELEKFKEKPVGRVDFFIQGFFLSTGILMTPVAVAVGTGLWFGARMILNRRRG